MTLNPLLAAPSAIRLHAFAAIAAFVVGLVILARRKGTPAHRLAGRLRVALMAIVVLSSFAIHTIRTLGPWRPIHLLSIWTAIVLPYGVWQIRRGNVHAHPRTMLLLFAGALVIAGAFTFYPGRTMHAVAFGG